ncbi:hypothetical protein ABPG74_021949 [Tetrahymena malaccensis]
MVQKLIFNKFIKKKDDNEKWIQFSSSNTNINLNRLHECSLSQFNKAITELRKTKYSLPEFQLEKIMNSQHELAVYINQLPKDVLSDVKFLNFLSECSIKRKTQIYNKNNRNFHYLPTIQEGMQESASQKINNVSEEDDLLVRRQSSAFSRTINNSIKNSQYLYDITKSEISKSFFKKSETNEIINENAIENSIHVDKDINLLSNDSSFKDIDGSYDNQQRKNNSQKANQDLSLTQEELSCTVVTEIDEDSKLQKSQYFGNFNEKLLQTLTTTRDYNSSPRSKVMASISSPGSNQSLKMTQEYQKQQYMQSQQIQLNLQQQLQQKQNLTDKQKTQFSQQKTRFSQSVQRQDLMPEDQMQTPEQNYLRQPQSTKNQKSQNSNEYFISSSNFSNSSSKNSNITPVMGVNPNQMSKLNNSQTANNFQNKQKVQESKLQQQKQNILTFPGTGNIANSIVGDFYDKSLSQTVVPSFNQNNQGTKINLEISESNATKINNKYKLSNNTQSQTQMSQNSRQQDFSSQNGGQAGNQTEMSQTLNFKQQALFLAQGQPKSMEHVPSKEEIQMKFIKETISHSQIGKQENDDFNQRQDVLGIFSREMISTDRKNRETACFSQESIQGGNSLGQTINYKQINQRNQSQMKLSQTSQENEEEATYKNKAQIEQQGMSTTIVFKNQPQYQQNRIQTQNGQQSFQQIFSNPQKKSSMMDSNLLGGQVTSQVLHQENQEIDEGEKNSLQQIEFLPSMGSRKASQSGHFSKEFLNSFQSQKMLNSEFNRQSVFQTGHFKSVDPNSVIESKLKKSNNENQERFNQNTLYIQDLQKIQESKIIDRTTDKQYISPFQVSFSPKSTMIQQSNFNVPQIQIQQQRLTDVSNTPVLLSPKHSQQLYSVQQSGSVTIVPKKRFEYESIKEETFTSDKVKQKMFINFNNNRTAESQEIEGKSDQQQNMVNKIENLKNNMSNINQQDINKKNQESNIKDDQSEQPKGEKKKLYHLKEQNSQFSNNKKQKGFSGGQYSSSSSGGKDYQNSRKNDFNMYQDISVNIYKSLVHPLNQIGASTIMNNLNALQVSEITGLKNSVYVTGNGQTDDAASKDKIPKAFNPIQASDWCITFNNQKGDVEIKTSQENAIGENYRTILKKLCLKGDEKNQAIYDKVKVILEEQKFTELEIIGRGSYGLVLKVKNQQGFERAIKVQLINADDQDQYKDGEFKIGKYLTDDGTENLYGQIITLHNIYILQDTESEHRIYLMEMELAESSLSKQISKRVEKGKMTDPFPQDEFISICRWCIQTLVRIHNSGCVHRDVKTDNILKMGNNFLFTDFGESEYVYNLKNLHIKQTDTFRVRQKFTGTLTYLSPLLRECYNKLDDNQSSDQLYHDPFKSDIYSLGLVFLQIKLFMNGMNKTEIFPILKDPKRAYEEAQANNINHIILKQKYFIFDGQEYECINILQSMLEIDETKRMSTIKLALICQIDKQFLSRIIIPYPKIFRPKQIKEDYGNNMCKVNYSIKYMEYEGETLKIGDKILRHGRGKLFRHEKNSKTIIYEGFWSKDLPHGQGKLSKIFQDDWEYEGQFYKGVFHGKGEIRFNGNTVYSGEFRNYILKEFLIPKQACPQSGTFKLEAFAKKMYKIKKKADNQEQKYCFIDKKINLFQKFRFCLQIKLHQIPHIENLLCLLKESKSNFLRLRLKNYKKINMDSVSHAPNQQEIYKKRDIFIVCKKMNVEVIYDEEFTFTDYQLESILQICNQIEYIDLKFISQEQATKLFSGERSFDYLKQIKNANDQKFSEEFFCNLMNSKVVSRLDIIEYENKSLFGLGLKRIFEKRVQVQFVKEINLSNSYISAQNESFQSFFASDCLNQINKLNLHNIGSLNDESLRIISSSKYLQNLKELDISQCSKVTHKGLNQFSTLLQQNLPQLQVLRIGGLVNPKVDTGLNKYLFNPTMKMLESLFKNATNLQELDLGNSQMLTDSVVKTITITKHLPNLLILILSKCPLLTHKSFEYFHRQTNNLKILEMVDFSYTKITLNLSLKKPAQSIKKLKIAECQQIDWNQLAGYLQISHVSEIYFDSDLLEYVSKQKEEDYKQAIRLLKNYNIFLNIVSELSLEYIIKFFDKKNDLKIRIYSLTYPEYQLEKAVITQIKKLDKHAKFKIKDCKGVSFKERIEEARAKVFKYKHYQILEQPLQVLDQDYDNYGNQQLSANEERFEDLKRILNGRLFLEFHLLDLKNEQQFAHLIIKPLAQSKFTRGLEMIDLSNSIINDEDLYELTKSQYFQKLESICINNCQEITEIGINCLIESIQGFPALKEIQVQQKFVNFQNLNLNAWQKRGQAFKIIIDTLQIRNIEVIRDEKMFLQYAQQICSINQSIISTISVIGTPFLISKILYQLSQNTPSPLKYVTIEVSISSENEIEDIQQAISLIQNFNTIESLFFDFRKLRFLSYSLMKSLFKCLENLSVLKQLKIMIKNYGRRDYFLDGGHIIELFENLKKFTQLKKLSIYFKQKKNVNQQINKIMTDKIGTCIRSVAKNLQEMNIQFINWDIQQRIQGFNIIQFTQFDTCKSLQSLTLNFRNMLKSNRDYIKDETVKSLTDGLKGMQFLRQLSLNLKKQFIFYFANLYNNNTQLISWGKKNEYITDQSLIYIKELLQANKNLKLFDINLKNWEQCSIKTITEFIDAINQQQKLQTLWLNLAKWGVFNSTLVGDIIEKLLEKNGEQIQNLKINFSKSFKLHQKNVSDSNLIQLFTNISKINDLTSFHLNLSNWGQNNELITNDCLQGFNQILSKKKLKSLTLKIKKQFLIFLFQIKLFYLKSWGCENNRITDTFIPNLVQQMSNLNDLEYLYLNFQGMGQFISDNKIGNQEAIKQIGECLLKSKKLKTIKLNMNNWKTETDEDCLFDMFKQLQKRPQPQEIQLSLAGWFSNKDNFSKKLQEYENQVIESRAIQKLNFNFSNWMSISQAIEAQNIYFNMFQLENILDLTLDFSKWNKLSDNFESELILLLSNLQELQNLKSLDLNLSYDLRQELDISRNLKIQLEQSLTKLIQLETLKLNLKGWTFKNSDIQNEVIEYIFLGISRLIKMRVLQLNMDDWNSNTDISKANFEIFSKNLKDLRMLSKIYLSFENWYQQPSKNQNISSPNNNKPQNEDYIISQYNFLIEKLLIIIDNAKLLDYFFLNLQNWPFISKKQLYYLETTLTNMNIQHKLVGKLFNNDTIMAF